MKHIKSIMYASLLAPATIVPCLTSSCSVFSDCKKDFKPSYDQLNQNLNFDSARTKWFEKANSINNFVEDELFWSNHVASLITSEGTAIEEIGLTYKSSFSQYLVNFSYAKVANGTKKLLSYKVNAEIEEKDEYYRNGEYVGYGITHYSIAMEVKNLCYDVAREYNKYLEKTFWLLKPVKYDLENGWKDWLSDDEELSFTIRELVEIYNKDGIQSYGVETTESAIMDKNISYVSQMEPIIDCFLTYWSYYLDPCTYVE